MPSAAPMRAKVKTSRPISARSRRPTTVVVSMLSSSWRASVAASTGVLPVRTTYLGPRTAAAGFTASTWPTTSQSNSMRTAASHCLTLGGAKLAPEALDPGGDVHRLDVEQAEAGMVAPVEEFGDRPEVSAAGVRVADVGGEEFDEAAAGMRAARGDQRRHGGVVAVRRMAGSWSEASFIRFFIAHI